MKLPRYSPAAFGGMSHDPNGRYVDHTDVIDMLHEALPPDQAAAIVHQYIDIPETSDERHPAHA